MDPHSDRITMNLGTWYGSVHAMIEAVVESSLQSTTNKRRYEIAEMLRSASHRVFHAPDIKKETH